MKSIKIKLNYQNKEKKLKILYIFNTLDLVSKDYLSIRLKEIQNKIYKPFKEHYANYRLLYPDINSGILQSSLREIDKAIKSYIAICKKNKKLVTFPENIKASIPLRNDMFHFELNKKSKSFDAWLKFLKIYFPLNLCKYHLKALEDFESINCSSIIKDHKGNLCLRLVFETKEKHFDSNKALAIDLGIVKPIVCNDGKHFGSGRYIKHKKLEFGKKRARNQKLKGVISLKQSNWTNDLNHKLSKELIDYCLSLNISVLGLENLKGGHLANMRFRKYTWAFKDLINKIEYKATNAGLKVVKVDPAYTSQRCNKCGDISKENRQKQSDFICRYCNHKSNADLNAAKNIYYLTVLNEPNVNQANGKALNQKLDVL
jgi:IS605 OrfB family transposase